MKNILAENMLRFGTKNISEANIKKRLTESTLMELDPSWGNAQKYFAAQFIRQQNSPQFATANLIYLATLNTKDANSIAHYNIGIYKAAYTDYEVTGFITPVSMGLADYRQKEGLTDKGDLQITSARKQVEPDLKTAAYYINSSWEKILPDIAITHMNGRKAKLATAIASIKAKSNFTELGPMLNGTAKTVYDMIAAAN